MEQKNLKVVGHSYRKKDSLQLLLGKPLYVQDLAPAGALVVKLLRSPHPLRKPAVLNRAFYLTRPPQLRTAHCAALFQKPEIF